MSYQLKCILLSLFVLVLTGYAFDGCDLRALLVQGIIMHLPWTFYDQVAWLDFCASHVQFRGCTSTP